MSGQKKYQVFLRVVGTVSIEASADSPTEAAEKVCDAIHDEREPEFLNLDIDDLETYMPVAYNDENGDTKDIDVPKELVEQEVSNALVGSKLYALVSIRRDRNGVDFRPSVSFFLSEARAVSEMEKEYEKAIESASYPYISSGGRPYGPCPCCYINSKADNSTREWYVTSAELKTGKSGG